MKYNILNDLSLLTTIQEKNLRKVFDKVNLCIVNDVQESFINKENFTEVDLGFGYLNLLIEDDCVKYKFIPNAELEEALKELLVNGTNPLVDKAEKTLANKFLNIYKDFI